MSETHWDMTKLGEAPRVRPAHGFAEEGVEAVWLEFSSRRRIVRAQLCWTADTGDCRQRKWRAAPAAVDPKAGRVLAPLPAGTRLCYFNLRDDRGLVVSGEHVDFDDAGR